MDAIRIGDIEFRPGDHDSIVKYFPNTYYNAQERLLKEGFTLNSDGSMSKDCCTVNESCFKNEYSCYVVAFIEWNRAHDEFDVRSCGTRAFDLEEKDYRYFRQILDLIAKNNIREN